MSKLLKAVATKHRPHIAAKMTKENGYDAKKHLTGKHLHAAGVISEDEAKDLDDCVQQLGDAFSNNDDFRKAMLGDDAGPDDDGLDDDGTDGDDDDVVAPVTAKSKKVHA